MLINNSNNHCDMESIEEDYLSNSLNNFNSNMSKKVDWGKEFLADVSSIDCMQNLLSVDDDPLLLCDLDLRAMQIGSESTALDSSDKTSRSTSLFDSDEEDTVDFHSWRSKRVDEWDKTDSKNWFISAGLKLGLSYSQMSSELAVPGKELLRLSREDFIRIDANFGEKLFNLLHERVNAKYTPSGSEYSSEDEISIDGDNGTSDEDSDREVERTKKRVGRPSITKKSKEPRLKLWEFIRNALLNPEYCPRFIRWENYEERTFRFVQSARMAKLWGERNPDKNKTKKMTFDNFSRAMRYYYKQEIFVTVPSRRLVYKFGKNATGLETDCPNFDPNYQGN